MKVSVSEAAARLDELVKRAQAGDEVILTTNGDEAVRLVSARSMTAGERRAILDRLRSEAAANAIPGPSAARSQDFLYDRSGLPD